MAWRSIKELSKTLNVSMRTLRRRIKDNNLEHQTFGSKKLMLYKQEDIEEILEKSPARTFKRTGKYKYTTRVNKLLACVQKKMNTIQRYLEKV